MRNRSFVTVLSVVLAANTYPALGADEEVTCADVRDLAGAWKDIAAMANTSVAGDDEVAQSIQDAAEANYEATEALANLLVLSDDKKEKRYGHAIQADLEKLSDVTASKKTTIDDVIKEIRKVAKTLKETAHNCEH